MTQNFTLLDSCAWIAYLFNAPIITQIINSGQPLAMSVLSFYEIYRKLQKLHYSEEDISVLLELIKAKNALTIPVDETIIRKAFSYTKKLAMADAIIYASAQQKGFPLLTRDNDFRGLPNVQFI
ncbi:MAG: PIN domain-containing protein [Nanoarchaeota archaeon]|nr:PIN domain-containing protein [Nanoarchaeota archaeon]